MIPDHIQLKYQGFNNPYRKIFIMKNDFVACDFSDLVPSWKLEFSPECPKELFDQAIRYAEDRGYYSFYIISSLDKISDYLTLFTDKHYVSYIEEVILKNEKSINLIFWEWLFDTTNYQHDVAVIKFMLSQDCRDER